MQTKKLAELTVQELMLEEKKRKAIYIAFAALIGIMAGASIFGFILKGFTFFTVMPLLFTPLFLMNLKNYQDVKKEIKSRNTN